MTGLFDDFDEPAPEPIASDRSAVRYAERICEATLMLREEQARADGWTLLARSGCALNVWRTPDGRFFADIPNQRIDINAHLLGTKDPAPR